MADIKPILINKWYGGMSETNTLMSDGQFVFINSVDGKTNPEFLQLNREVIEVIPTGSALMHAIIEENQTNSFVFGDLGRIYSTATGNIVYNMTLNQKIINAITFFDAVAQEERYIRFYEEAGTVRLATILKSGAGVGAFPGLGSWLTVFENYGSFTPTPSAVGEAYCPAINVSEDFLYFSIGKRVYMGLTSQLPFFESPIAFEDQIVGLTREGPLINIYLSNGKKYFRDGFSETVEGFVDIGIRILYVFDTRDADYIVAGSRQSTKLYVSQGQQFQLLKTTRFFLENALLYEKFAYGTDDSRYGNYTMAFDKSNLYLSSDGGQAQGIEAFGNIIQGLPKGSTLETTKAHNGLGIATRGLIYIPLYQTDTLYFAIEDDSGSCFIERMFTDRVTTGLNYNSTGFIITQKYDFGVPIHNRSIEYMFRSDTPTGTTITIDYKVDDGAFVNLTTISGSDKKHRVLQSVGSVPFFEIQWRITLTTTDQTISPKLYNMLVKYEQIDN